MAKSKPPKPPGHYDVGYGRPPVHSRFPPGQSGNPAGRRKGQPTPNEIFMKEAARLVKIKRGDTVETITKHEAIIRRHEQLSGFPATTITEVRKMIDPTTERAD